MPVDHIWDASCPVCCDPHGIVDELRAELDRLSALLATRNVEFGRRGSVQGSAPRPTQWEPTTDVPPTVDKVEPQTPAPGLWSPGLRACLGECFGPYASPDTWAKMVADLRAELDSRSSVDDLLATLRGALPSALWAIQIGETNDEGWYLELVDSCDNVLRSWYGEAVEEVVRQALTYATTAGAEG